MRYRVFVLTKQAGVIKLAEALSENVYLAAFEAALQLAGPDQIIIGIDDGDIVRAE